MMAEHITKLEHPDPFFIVRGHRPDWTPTLVGLCVGYEAKKWRSGQLADHILDWLAEFALTPSEFTRINHANSRQFLRLAASAVYKSNKFKSRGEFGELFLHAAIRQVHDSLPAISKIYYKTASNDTVKGFDAVHIVGPPDDMELWLGEAKFYSSINKAISDVVSELRHHLGSNYLRQEFAFIKGKLDNTWPHTTMLRKLLSHTTSLDEVFKRVCVPVLLTYESDCIAKYDSCTQEYISDFEKEVSGHYNTFKAKSTEKGLPTDLQIHLFLMPLHEKKVLISELDKVLKRWQTL